MNWEDFLEKMQESPRKTTTQIAEAYNLNFEELKIIIDKLKSNKYIKLKYIDNINDMYIITPLGMTYLNSKELIKMSPKNITNYNAPITNSQIMNQNTDSQQINNVANSYVGEKLDIPPIYFKINNYFGNKKGTKLIPISGIISAVVGILEFYNGTSSTIKSIQIPVIVCMVLIGLGILLVFFYGLIYRANEFKSKFACPKCQGRTIETDNPSYPKFTERDTYKGKRVEVERELKCDSCNYIYIKKYNFYPEPKKL